ncbi:MAG TPA: acetyl-CoA carboxylase carboxyl transferase subunit alpha, partial [Lachnospiraceae bacterium]|nr:acetyl-CoA carboxylase carboxyl transferase subunit alpha [Lachnospiraceae bacterium]
GFASILWRDSSRVAEAAELMKMTARDLLKNEVIDRMFLEPEEGLENNIEKTATELKRALLETLPDLMNEETALLLEKRYQRFRKFGEFTE